MTFDKIRALRALMRTFVFRANRIVNDGTDYEPPLDKSHIWAELVSTVEHANDTLQDIDEK